MMTWSALDRGVIDYALNSSMAQQRYIVTSRGRNRQHGILVTVEGDSDGDLHKLAHEKARAQSAEIRSYGTEISAFVIGAEKAAKWSQMESDLASAEVIGDWEAARVIRQSQHDFLNAL